MKGHAAFLGVLLALMLIPAIGLFASSAPLEWKEEEIERLAQAFLCLSQTLEAKGIGLTVLIAPNKNTLYPEYMSTYMVPAGGERNLPRLIERPVALGVDTLDVAVLLESRKADGLLYHPTDSHWNARGAFWVHQELRSRLMARYSIQMPDYKEQAGGLGCP